MLCLIALDKFRNESKAIEWLVTEGIKANRNYLNKVADVRKQIEQIETGSTNKILTIKIISNIVIS